MAFPYLKKGGGKLASDYHGVTDFAKRRKEKIIAEQLEREKNVNIDQIGWVRYSEKKQNNF